MRIRSVVRTVIVQAAANGVGGAAVNTVAATIAMIGHRVGNNGRNDSLLRSVAVTDYWLTVVLALPEHFRNMAGT